MVYGSLRRRARSTERGGEPPSTSRRRHDTIRLNFESLEALDRLLVDGLSDFVNGAPDDWRRDGFLVDRSPIVVTSRFGQNARVGIEGNELNEALEWQLERDYSKIAFLTVAIATSIRCVPGETPLSSEF